MLTDEEIFTGFAYDSPLNLEAPNLAAVDAIATAWLATEGVEDWDDSDALAALPEAPEPVLEAARAALTVPDPATAIAALYADHCQPRVEIDDYDTDGHGGVYVVPSAWHVRDCADMGALATALHEPDRSLSTSEAAAMVGVTRGTFVRYLDAGRIPYTQPGTHRRVRRSDVLAFIARTTHGQGAQ